jgi:hypothetical protein
MSDPVLVPLVADTWTLVATAILSANVDPRGVAPGPPPSMFRYTYRDTGNPAPVNDAGVVVGLGDRDRAAPSVRAEFATAMDLYIMAVGGAAECEVHSPTGGADSAWDAAHFGAVGAAADVDGVIHGQLRYIGESVDSIPEKGTAAMAASLPVTIATDDVVSTATGIHDVAAAAKLGGMRLIGNATAALQAAVAANDDAKINTDLSGQVRLASHTIATTSDRSEEIDPLSAQYDAISLVSLEAVAADPGASYAPSSAGQAWGGYGPLSIGLYLLGGVGAAAADRTVTVTIEATNGQTVAAAVAWADITESVKSLKTGVDSAASFTSTGATAYSDILTLRREDSNFTHFRVKYDWDADPSVTPGRIVAMARGAAL